MKSLNHPVFYHKSNLPCSKRKNAAKRPPLKIAVFITHLLEIVTITLLHMMMGTLMIESFGIKFQSNETLLNFTAPTILCELRQ